MMVEVSCAKLQLQQHITSAASKVSPKIGERENEISSLAAKKKSFELQVCTELRTSSPLFVSLSLVEIGMRTPPLLSPSPPPPPRFCANRPGAKTIAKKEGWRERDNELWRALFRRDSVDICAAEREPIMEFRRRELNRNQRLNGPGRRDLRCFLRVVPRRP